MLTSVAGLSRFALPMLSVLLLALSGAPSPAQGPGPLAPRSAPGQVTETIGTAAVVLSTVHYQAELVMSPDSSSCSGDFPKLGGRRRLNVTRMTCVVQGPTTGSTFLFGELELRGADNSHVLYHWLPVDHSEGSIHTLNRAVDVQVSSRQHIHLVFVLSGGHVISDCYCTASTAWCCTAGGVHA